MNLTQILLSVFLTQKIARMQVLRALLTLIIFYYFIRVDKGGCDMREAKGFYFWLIASGIWIVSSDIGREHRLKECYIDQSCWISPVRS